ncbi:type VI secretion system tip protein VgrG [Reichenbachiella sp.]|uniref:type VI secretion system tip protein VgrG n=1 Tax=Reichenbachiella sp. TaxID=2184521 RepID=UPI00329A577D
MNTDIKKTSGLVTYTLLVDGAEADQPLEILSIRTHKEVNRIPYARITLIDGDVAIGDFEVSNSEDFIPGKELVIQAGYESENDDVFIGTITKHSIKIREGRSVLILECRDDTAKMTIGRNSDYFYELKDSEIIEEITGKYGLETEIEPTDVVHKEMVQYEATDWDFILSRAEANGKVIVVEDGKLSAVSPDEGQSPEVELIYGDSIIELEAEVEARTQYAGTAGASWDPSGQAMIEEEGENLEISDPGNLSPTDLADIASPETVQMKHGGAVTGEELKAWADAKFLKSSFSRVRGWIKCPGLSGIKLGTVITVSGVGERFNGNVYISAVKHEIFEGNWTTDIQFGLSTDWFAEKHGITSPPAGGLLPGIHGLQIGIVKQVGEDPDGEHRILVVTPNISEEKDGLWARVAASDAGDSRGIFFRPEIDDEVVIGFLQDDPRYPVVLGMLHSSAKPAPLEASDDNNEKGIITKSEMKVLFNDEDPSLLISTPGGNEISLSESDEAITIKDQNDNKIAMTADGIEIESSKDLIFKAAGDVKIEGTNIESVASGDAKTEGVNIEIKASAEFKADGGAGAEVTTGAIAVLKGSLVQIN